MVEGIIDQLRSSPQGSRLIVEMATHSHASSPAGRIADMQRYLSEHIRECHAGDVEHFVWCYGSDPEVKDRALTDYGRKTLGLA